MPQVIPTGSSCTPHCAIAFHRLLWHAGLRGSAWNLLLSLKAEIGSKDDRTRRKKAPTFGFRVGDFIVGRNLVCGIEIRFGFRAFSLLLTLELLELLPLGRVLSLSVGRAWGG